MSAFEGFGTEHNERDSPWEPLVREMAYNRVCE